MNLQVEHKVVKSLLNLTSGNSFKETLNKNKRQISPSYKILTFSVFVMPLIMYICSRVFQSNNTLDVIKEINTTFLTIFIALIAIVITGYALFQAMISRNHAIKLLSIEEGDQSQFSMYNGYFFILSFTYFLIIVLEIVVNIFLTMIRNNIIVLHSVDFIGAYVLSLYVLVNIVLLWEFKSFVYNLYICFISNIIISITSKDEAAAESSASVKDE